jgi:hypothetical protein
MKMRAADHTLCYGKGSQHVIELWQPETTVAARAVVVIHGGFWADGPVPCGTSLMVWTRCLASPMDTARRW